ncbi:DUF6264 family protein [Mycetocola saprophilus]|uniref:DUF6264 family protein n=1 Tax=Mycetocola saprophilus TaxID=76636 RepID=UPI003BF33ECE
MTPQPRFGEFATPEEQRDQMNGPDAEKASAPAVDQTPRRPSFGERIEDGAAAATPSEPAVPKDPESASAPRAVAAPQYGERVAEDTDPEKTEGTEPAATDSSPAHAERVAASQLPPPEYGERVADSQLPPPEYGERTTDAPTHASAPSTPAAPADGIPRYAAGSFSGVNVGNRPAVQASAGARAGAPVGNGVNRAGAPAAGAAKRPAAALANDGLPVQAPADRFISLILLAFGAFSILTSVPALLNLREAFVEYFKELGISGDSLGQSINVSGWVMAAIMIAVWCLSAWWTMRRIRAGKSSWWIPLLGAVVALLVMSMVLAPVMANDPAFQEYVKKFQP